MGPGVEPIDGVWMGPGMPEQPAWMWTGGSRALVGSEGVRKGCLSEQECFCVSVCLLPELCVWPSTHDCIHTILSHRPRLGPGARPPALHLLGPSPTHLFANFEQTQEPSSPALWAAQGLPE